MAASQWYITLQAVNPSGPPVVCGLVDDSEVGRGSGSGGGGWKVVDRPKRLASTEWVDYSPLQMTMSLILDGGEGLSPNSVEPQIAIIESWELPAPGGLEPSKLSVTGPVPHNDKTWVLNSLKWKAAIRDFASGNRTQQFFDVVLWEYSPASVTLSPLSSPAAAAQAAQAAGPATSSAGTTTAIGIGPVGPGETLSTPTGVLTGSAAPAASGQTYIVRSGDTLSSIAARVLGNVNLWQAIASLNGIRDPNSISAGQVLKLPASSTAPSSATVPGLRGTVRPV